MYTVYMMMKTAVITISKTGKLYTFLKFFCGMLEGTAGRFENRFRGLGHLVSCAAISGIWPISLEIYCKTPILAIAPIPETI
jgi:hypothetical protein